MVNWEHFASVMVNWEHFASVVVNWEHFASVVVNWEYFASVVVNWEHFASKIIPAQFSSVLDNKKPGAIKWEYLFVLKQFASIEAGIILHQVW